MKTTEYNQLLERAKRNYPNDVRDVVAMHDQIVEEIQIRDVNGWYDEEPLSLEGFWDIYQADMESILYNGGL